MKEERGIVLGRGKERNEFEGEQGGECGHVIKSPLRLGICSR